MILLLYANENEWKVLSFCSQREQIPVYPYTDLSKVSH